MSASRRRSVLLRATQHAATDQPERIVDGLRYLDRSSTSESDRSADRASVFVGSSARCASSATRSRSAPPDETGGHIASIQARVSVRSSGRSIATQSASSTSSSSFGVAARRVSARTAYPASSTSGASTHPSCSALRSTGSVIRSTATIAGVAASNPGLVTSRCASKSKSPGSNHGAMAPRPFGAECLGSSPKK